MKPREIRITFQPSGRSVYVLPGTLLLEAAGRAGIALQTPCGGCGTCGKCKVLIPGPECPPPSDADSHILSNDQLEGCYRLACQTYVERPLTVEIPRESQFGAAHRILTACAGRTVPLKSVIRKQPFRLDVPSSIDAVSDIGRLRSAIGDVDIPFPLMRDLARFLRVNNWRGTAVTAGNRLLCLEPGDTSQSAYGISIDLGTTTLAGNLYDLVTGTEKAVTSMINPQVVYGDDVISRISRVRESGSALHEMQRSAVEAINAVIVNLTRLAGIDTNHIYETVIAGNSTMQQILCGFDPSALGEVPFVQTFDASLTLPARDLGLAISPGGEAFIFPQIGGFVGGDTVAGMLAAGLEKVSEPTLLVDIGTNGEIVLAHDGRMQATSTAAGPAFEGARIVQGMRASAGAIEKVVIRDDVLFNVIGNVPPAGICGTALIDTAAELLRKGIMDETGRILQADEAPSDLPDSLRKRLITERDRTNFMIVPAEESASGEPVFLWQKDVRELQLAAGAIRAGINILLRRACVAPERLGAVLLAGAFGNFIRRNNARRIGLLPQIPCERIHFIGNASLLGARLALLSADERRRADALRGSAEHVDLSLDPEFQTEFAMAMMFPADDVDACAEPGVGPAAE